MEISETKRPHPSIRPEQSGGNANRIERPRLDGELVETFFYRRVCRRVRGRHQYLAGNE
jgi:hypothetical protein